MSQSSHLVLISVAVLSLPESCFKSENQEELGGTEKVSRVYYEMHLKI